jgi:hypothetical protein
MIESVEAEAESYGWEIEKQDEYDHEIADKDFIVVEMNSAKIIFPMRPRNKSSV